VGDLNGDGRPDLGFLCAGWVRLFYQSEIGIEPRRFVDLDIVGDQLAGDDLGDGCAELIVRSKAGQVSVYRGSIGGIRRDDLSCIAGSHLGGRALHLSRARI